MDERHTNLQGTWAYSAKRLREKGDLVVGSSLSMRREPNNKHDANAVSIYLGRSKIGFLPRGLAVEVASYLDCGGKYRCSISHVGSRTYKRNTYPSISVELVLDDKNPPESLTSLLDGARLLLGVNGVYRITNKVDQRSYIGSSSDVGKRLRRHFSSLRAGIHHNQSLMRAWNKHGPSAFELSLMERVSTSKLQEREKVHIERLGTHVHGYNQTADGSGASPLPASVRTTLGLDAPRRQSSARSVDPKLSREPHSSPKSVKDRHGCLTSILFCVATGTGLFFL